MGRLGGWGGGEKSEGLVGGALEGAKRTRGLLLPEEEQQRRERRREASRKGPDAAGRERGGTERGER